MNDVSYFVYDHKSRIKNKNKYRQVEEMMGEGDR